MIPSYFISFCRNNIVKVAALILSISIYFAFALNLITLNDILPEVASLPFKLIGIETIVQKTGQIPSHMTGAIFPHSNGPIYTNEIDRLKKLKFVEDSDAGLYFWYFDSSYFKTIFGVNITGHIFPNLLKQNIETGRFSLAGKKVLITKDFAEKNNLTIDSRIKFGEDVFIVSAILKSNLSGNIIPADIYMELSESEKIARRSSEMREIYKFKAGDFVNVVALKTAPGWQGDKEKIIKNISKDYIIFSEKTFSKEVINQVQIISSLGRIVFAVLGIVVILIFGLLITFNFKSREKEIAILRMIGWSLRDLKKQFITESMIIVCAGIVLGNVLGSISLFILKNQKITMELPWELSAKPHFMPSENAINRVITAGLPVHFNPILFILLSSIFLILFGLINFILFRKIGKIKPHLFLK